MRKIFLLVFFLICGDANDFDPTTHPNWRLLNHERCGQVDSHRIIGGQNAPMNAYPWLVRIGYSSTDEPEHVFYRCGGVIANSETVITAAHCVDNLPPIQMLKMLRFGEHDTLSDPDCEDDFCADPVVDIRPVTVIVPENYNEHPFKHDIAIIKLAKPINFTTFIKPICFPFGNLYTKNLVGSIGEVAGWGITDIDNPESSIKLQRVKLPVVNISQCTHHYPKVAHIGDTQLCIGGEVGKDSCGGDSGGPVMMVDDSNGEPRYYVLGLVSFGAKKCGKSESPGVYTKITSYMKWVLDNLGETENTGKVTRLKIC